MSGEVEKIPNPGTTEAVILGCLCPVVDNHHGQGYKGRKDSFIYDDRCKVHPSGSRVKDISPPEPKMNT